MNNVFIVCKSITILVCFVLSSCSLEVKQKAISIEDPYVADQIKNAEVLFNNESYEEALKGLIVAEGQAKLLRDKKGIAEIMSNGGFILSEQKKFENASDYYQASLEINEAIGNQSGAIINYSYLGKISEELGKYYEAITFFERALKKQKRINDQLGQIENINNLGNLYSILGEYRQALTQLNQALSLAREQAVPRLIGKTIINLGALNYNLRNYRQAEAFLREGVILAEKAKDEALKASAFMVLGAVYRQQGDFEKALEYYQSALRINEHLKLSSVTATNARILGELYLHRVQGEKQENKENALNYLMHAAKINREERDSLAFAMTMSHLGEYYYFLKQYKEALDWYQKAFNLFRALDFPDGLGRTHINLGFTHGDMGDLDVAVEEFNKAIRIYEALGEREWNRVALFGKAVFLEKKGLLAEAERNYKKAIDIFESIRADVTGGEDAQELFTEVNAKVYENLVALLVDKGDIEGALEYVERSRLRALREYIWHSNSITSETRGKSDLDQLTQLSRAAYSLTNTRRTTKHPETRDRIAKALAKNELETLKQIGKLKLQKEFAGKSTTLEIVPQTRTFRYRTDFPDDLAILTYFLTSDNLYIFVALKGRQAFAKVIEVSREELNERIWEATKLIAQKPTAENLLDYRGVLKGLYYDIVGPIEKELKNINTIAVLPVGFLSYLPFEALLMDKSDGKTSFLVQEKNIVYLANQTYVNTLAMLAEERSPDKIDSVVAFGNPDLSLHYAEEEVKAIKEFFPKSEIFLHDNASKINFNAYWGEHHVVHVAAHAKLASDGATILLAPPRSGTLTLDDIFILPENQNTRFIALSACMTGIDRVIAEGAGSSLSAEVPMVSMVYAFSMRDVSSILVTLWNIHDKATSILMSDFYRNLKHGEQLYQAFRNAQMRMIERNDNYRHPYYWAPFIFYGLDQW